MDAPSDTTFLMAFLPWLHLKRPASVIGVTFRPVSIGKAGSPFGDQQEDIERILSGYVDIKSRPVTTPTVAFVEQAGGSTWHLSHDDENRITIAATLILLAGFSANTYHQSKSYVNSAAFEVVWQKFRRPAIWMALEVRRRDGYALDGGYKHGELKFTIPIQIRYPRPVDIDHALLDALTQSHAKQRPVMDRLQTALSAFSIANSDSSMLSLLQELVWIAAAFEILLNTGSKCDSLGTTFATKWRDFGTVTIKENSVSANPLNVRDQLRLNGQSEFVHRIWIEELCALRGMTMHGSPTEKKKTNWNVDQHRLMGVFVFPLLVKVLLHEEKYYSLTPDDIGSARAVDKLLTTPDWNYRPEEHTSSEQSGWNDVLDDQILLADIEHNMKEL
jgi:hypothetical protein